MGVRIGDLAIKQRKSVRVIKYLTFGRLAVQVKKREFPARVSETRLKTASSKRWLRCPVYTLTLCSLARTDPSPNLLWRGVKRLGFFHRIDSAGAIVLRMVLSDC